MHWHFAVNDSDDDEDDKDENSNKANKPACGLALQKETEKMLSGYSSGNVKGEEVSKKRSSRDSDDDGQVMKKEILDDDDHLL